MRTTVIAIAAALAGCDGVFNLVEVLPDAEPTAPVCYGTGDGLTDRFCTMPGDRVRANLSASIIDTGDCESLRTLSDGQEVCVVFFETIDLAGALRATGPRPLVLAADVIIVQTTGTIDVSSDDGLVGAGANLDCDRTGSDGTDGATNNGGGGGAGGSFVGRGGAGGRGSTTSMPGGMARAPLVPPTIRGGCAGGRGGAGTLSAPEPASGGGALYLAARQSISISGTLLACGAGGPGGGIWAGGGGGGAGGLLGLDAPLIEIFASAQLFAAGGGGGEGGGSANPGTNGEGGRTGNGGTNSTSGGQGGAGSGGNASDGAAGAALYPGGGGGGGGGFIAIYAEMETIATGATSVPPLP